MNTKADLLLSVSDLHAYYSESHVLHGVDFKVMQGELVSLLGRNGSGRSTILKCILGLLPKRTGSIRFEGAETVGLPSYQIARMGMGYCPEDRGIFSKLTVKENLYLPPTLSSNGMSTEEIFELFPNLAERMGSMGTQLSGGEQQMLAMARILRTGAKLLLLDEITEGLAPVIVKVLGEAIRALKKRGYTIILVEQNFRFTAGVADRYYVIENGRVAEMVSRGELAQSEEKLSRYLSV